MAEKRNLEAACPTQQSFLSQPQPSLLQHQQPAMQPQQPVIIQVRRPPAKRYDKFKTVRSRYLGIAQIVCGVLAVILHAIGIGMQEEAHDAVSDDRYSGEGYGSFYWRQSSGYFGATGFWCPVFFFISGSFAIWASKSPTKCPIITCFVMTIISIVMAVIMLAIASLIISEDAKRLSKGFDYEITFHGFRNSTYYQTPPPPKKMYSDVAERWARAVMSISPLFFIVSILEVVATIWTCILCGNALCCAESGADDQYQSVQYQANYGQPQIMVLDRSGRPLTGAQVIQLPAVAGSSAMQAAGPPTMTSGSPVIQATGPPIITSGIMAPPGGQAMATSGQMVAPTVLQPGVNQPHSQSGEHSPPPPYQ